MDKETFDKLIADIPKYRADKQKELEENDLIVDYDEEREEVYVLIWKIPYIFDQKGYALLEKLWEKGCLTPDKQKYLCVKDEWGDLIPVHNYLKREDVEKLAKELGVPTQDIHVHHIDKDPEKKNNSLNNLEVLHKDVHAQRHGFLTWEEYQNWRKSKGI